jgi:hypothetical protein
MSDPAEPVKPPSSEALLVAARNRDPDRQPQPLPEARAQLGVRDNILRNIGTFFAPDPGGAAQFILNPDLHLDRQGKVREIRDTSDPDSVYEIVSWEFVGVHTRSFRGVAATGRPVWFRGLTIAQRADSKSRFTYSQFIDWREVLLQLGIAPEASRPLVGAEDIERREEIWAKHPPASNE